MTLLLLFLLLAHVRGDASILLGTDIQATNFAAFIPATKISTGNDVWAVAIQYDKETIANSVSYILEKKEMVDAAMAQAAILIDSSGKLTLHTYIT